MLKKVLSAVLFVAVLTALALAQEDAGLTAYEAGEYESAARIWRELADQGNTVAQFNLGISYQKGLGVEQDTAVAFHWFRRAAEHGHGGSQYNLGVMFANANGVERDYVKAYLWTSLAVDSLSEGEERDSAVRVREVISRRMDEEELVRTRGIDPKSLLADAVVEEEPNPLSTQSDEPGPASSTLVVRTKSTTGPDQDATGAEPAGGAEPFSAPTDPSPTESLAGDTATTFAQAATEAGTPTATSFGETSATGEDWTIQLASYLSRGMAEKGWRGLSADHAGLLAGFEPVIESADREDMGTIYRLKIGAFADRPEADALCADLRADGADCIVTRLP